MGGILVRKVERSLLLSDIHETARRLSPFCKVLTVEGEEIKREIRNLSSSLFPPEDLVLVLVDPRKETLKEIESSLYDLSKKIWIIICETEHSDKVAKKGYLGEERERRLKKKVLSFLKGFGKTMTDKAFNLFARNVTDDAFVENELLKLVNYVGEREQIRSKDVEEITIRTEEATLFSLFEIIKETDKRKILKVLNNLFDCGFHPLLINTYLERLVRLLIQSKEFVDLLESYYSEGSFVRKFSDLKNLFPFVPGEKKNYFPYLAPRYALSITNCAKRISLSRLKEFFKSLSEYDFLIKTGTKFERTRLEMIVLRIMDA